jgi:hypothetical protein
MTPKIIDAFPYNGDELLQYRLEYLYDVVDLFVIVEAGETFSGAWKDRFFIDAAIPHLYKYMDKIVFVKQDRLPPRPDWYTYSSNNNPDDWWRELAQRELSKNAIKQYVGDHPYLVIVGDVDEIPDKRMFENVDALYQMASQHPIFMLQDFYYYNFDWIKADKWGQAYIISDKLVDQQPFSFWKVFGGDPRWQRVIGGWHFSYFMSKANIKRKLESIGHTEVNQQAFKTDEWIKTCLTTGKDLFNRPNQDCLKSNHEYLPEGWKQVQTMLESIQC